MKRTAEDFLSFIIFLTFRTFVIVVVRLSRSTVLL